MVKASPDDWPSKAQVTPVTVQILILPAIVPVEIVDAPSTPVTFVPSKFAFTYPEYEYGILIDEVAEVIVVLAGKVCVPGSGVFIIVLHDPVNVFGALSLTVAVI